MRKLYFAYGSNLNLGQMAGRCPDAEFIAPAILEDHALIFRGVADVIPEEGSRVMGGVFSITRRCELRLDRYEGWPTLYGKKIVNVTVDPFDEGSRSCGPDMAMVYTMTRRSEVCFPSDRYLRSIEEGYDDCGLDRSYLHRALNELPHRLRVA